MKYQELFLVMMLNIKSKKINLEQIQQMCCNVLYYVRNSCGIARFPYWFVIGGSIAKSMRKISREYSLNIYHTQVKKIYVITYALLNCS